MKRILAALSLLAVSLVALCLLAVSVSALADDQLSLTTGFDYSTGKYGNAISTDILYVPIVGQYETDNLTLKLTVPYISVSGPGGVIQGFGRIASPVVSSAGASRFGRPTTNSGAVSTTNSGLGDVIASAGYTVYSAGALSLDVVGKIKFGTADATKGLGTGMNDYLAQIDGYYALIEKTTIFATLGYKVVGSPMGISANNVSYGMLGANQKLSDAHNVGLMLNYVQSAFATAANQEDLTVYASQKLSKSLKLQENILKGFANGSPDYAGGVMVTGMF